MCARVDISQKIYPIITDSYHYHFLRLCSPYVQLIESVNVNILFKYQCNLTICPASKNSTTDKLDRRLIRAGEDRRPKTPFTLTVHLFPWCMLHASHPKCLQKVRELDCMVKVQETGSDYTCRVIEGMIIYVRSSPILLTFPHFALIKTVNNQGLRVRACVWVCEREPVCVGRHNVLRWANRRIYPSHCRQIKCTLFDFNKSW